MSFKYLRICESIFDFNIIFLLIKVVQIIQQFEMFFFQKFSFS
ncbi:hypothetical protein pb186bvf_013188 [Paramecium bursaria]